MFFHFKWCFHGFRPIPSLLWGFSGVILGQDNLFGDWACMRKVLQEGQGFGSLQEGSEVGDSYTLEHIVDDI